MGSSLGLGLAWAQPSRGPSRLEVFRGAWALALLEFDFQGLGSAQARSFRVQSIKKKIVLKSNPIYLKRNKIDINSIVYFGCCYDPITINC